VYLGRALGKRLGNVVGALKKMNFRCLYFLCTFVLVQQVKGVP
jgi:hypothetical protein